MFVSSGQQFNNTILQVKSLTKEILKKEGNHQMYHQKR